MRGPKWTMHITISDGMGESYHMADEIDEGVIFSGMTPRLKDEMSMGAEVGLGVVSLDTVVDMMRKREFRRKALVAEMIRLANKMADTMEDAEGWHDASRVEPAKQALRPR